MIKDVIHNINLFVDGRGFAGKVAEITLPKLAPVMQEYKAGGLSAAVDVPMLAHEKLEAEMTLNAFDPGVLKLFGVKPGKQVAFTARGAALDDDGASHAVIVQMRGLIKEFDMGTWKPGEEATLKLSLSLRYYKLERDGAALIEADPINMVCCVNGADQLADTRKALGL